MKYLLVVCMLAAFAVGCSPVVWLKPSLISEPRNAFDSTTIKNTEHTVSVGSTMYFSELRARTTAVRYRNRVGIRFSNPYFSSWDGIGFDKSKKIDIPVDSLITYNQLFSVKERPQETWIQYSNVPTIAPYSSNSYFVIKSDSLIQMSFDALGKEQFASKFKTPIPVEKISFDIISDAEFRWELLYMGIQNNSIVLTYREFSKDMIRPGFTQAVYYNLNEIKDNVIGYKNLKIKILEYNNQLIKYKVMD